MRKIANILTDKKTTFSDCYNVVNTKDKLINGIPTLVIGWDFTKSIYPDASIVDWQINENTYWTFGNREKRDEYEKKVSKFGNIAVEHLVKSIEYRPLNLMTCSKDEKMEVFGYIDGLTAKEIYFSGDMVYIYIPSSNIVYGIFLKDIDYVGKSSKSFIAKLYGCDNKEIISGKVSDRIPNNLWGLLSNRVYIVPTLFYEGVL